MLDDKWWQEAEQRFPELLELDFADWSTPYQLWIDLLRLFKEAYQSTPRNEGLIARIYEYHRWCLEQPRGETAEDDLLTCVVVSFLEEIPDISEALNDMPKWFKWEDVLAGREVFSYLVGDEGFEKIREVFLKAGKAT